VIISILGAIVLMVGALFYMDIIKIQKKIPNTLEKLFHFKTLEGKDFSIKVGNRSFKIEGMEEKIVFLKVFGWDCDFCKKEIPELINLKKSLPDSFDVIAIEAQNHSTSESQNFIKEYGINYHIVEGKNQKNFYTYLQKQYGWTGIIPLTIVLSKEGYVLAFEIGSKSYSLSELFKSSLEKK
jgi:thiol-disulfide isomerase/thioredoxin